MSATPKANRSWPVVSLIILFILGASNVFLPLFIVPKFEQIFQDALGPDHPLPGITQFIIAARFPLALIALAWPIAGIVAIWQRHPSAIWIINLGSLFFFPLIGFTIIALFMPMGTLITGIPDTSVASPAASH